MGVTMRPFGEVQPICSDCGVGLCWSIDEIEYKESKSFWDEWRCRDCNPDYKGAYKKWKAANK